MLVWWLFDPPRLSSFARQAISDPDNTILTSAVSAFEVANKHRIGKWTEIASLAVALEEIALAQGFMIVPIDARHTSLAGLLQGCHRDPFDRVLAAQSQIENISIISADAQIRTLGADVIW